MSHIKKVALFLLIALSGCNPSPRAPDMSTVSAQKLKGVPVPGPAGGGYDTITNNAFTPLTKQKKIYPIDGLTAQNDTNGTDIIIDPAYSNTWTTNQTIYRSSTGANLQSFGVSLVAATAATNVLAQYSPSVDLACNYWNGTASASASWMVGAAGDSTTGGRFLIQKNNAIPADAFSIDYSTLSTKVFGPLTFSDNTQQGTAMASVSGQTGKYLTNNGSTTSWGTISTGVPNTFLPIDRAQTIGEVIADGRTSCSNLNDEFCVSLIASAWTMGSSFATRRALTITGIKFATLHVGSVSTQCNFWPRRAGQSGTAVTGTVTTTGPGIYTCNLSIAQSLASGQDFVVGIYNGVDITGYTSQTATATVDYQNGPSIQVVHDRDYCSGVNCLPGQTHTSSFPITPVFTVP